MPSPPLHSRQAEMNEPATEIESADAPVIEISNVWKIFGKNADAALEAIRKEGLGKAEVLEQYDADNAGVLVSVHFPHRSPNRNRAWRRVEIH